MSTDHVVGTILESPFTNTLTKVSLNGISLCSELALFKNIN